MTPAEPELLVIEAGRGERHYWRDLWTYRGLFAVLALRDIRVRYKQAVLGVAWAVVQPLVTTLIFVIVFGRIAQLPTGGVPYPLLVLSGLLPWQLFSSSLSGTGGSLVSNSSLISKVYFPRMIVPLAALGVALIDFLVGLALFVAIALWYGLMPTWHWLVLPAFILLASSAAFGVGLWLAALGARFRDFRFIIPFLLQAGIFISPVGYRTDLNSSWTEFLALNPLTAVIDGFRWCLLGGQQPINTTGLLYTLAVVALSIAGGACYFRRTERRFADVI